MLELSLLRFGADREEAVYVGDLPSVDVLGARAAGIRPILMDPWDAFPEVEVEKIRALSELALLLE